jgi:hypothetical protein
LNEFKELKSFMGDWSPGLDLGVRCKNVESVTLHKYKAKDFSEFSFVRTEIDDRWAQDTEWPTFARGLPNPDRFLWEVGQALLPFHLALA